MQDNNQDTLSNIYCESFHPRQLIYVELPAHKCTRIFVDGNAAALFVAEFITQGEIPATVGVNVYPWLGLATKIVSFWGIVSDCGLAKFDKTVKIQRDFVAFFDEIDGLV